MTPEGEPAERTDRLSAEWSTSPPRAWLVRDHLVLGACEIASSRSARRRGLLGRAGIEGALLIEGARSVHSIGMRFPIDVVYCDADLHVVHVGRLVPGRLSAPVWKATQVLEMEEGTAERWGLAVGQHLAVQLEAERGS